MVKSMKDFFRNVNNPYYQKIAEEAENQREADNEALFNTLFSDFDENDLPITYDD